MYTRVLLACLGLRCFRISLEGLGSLNYAHQAHIYPSGVQDGPSVAS